MSGSTVRTVASAVRWYGANPLHLLVLLASVALTAYAAVRLLDGAALRVAGWFVGSAILHDLLLFPLYALADTTVARVVRHRAATRSGNVPWINHVRFPAAISGILLVVWLPLILRLPPAYRGIAGYTTQPYLERWLLVTGALFLLSAAAYAVRLRRGR